MKANTVGAVLGAILAFALWILMLTPFTWLLWNYVICKIFSVVALSFFWCYVATFCIIMIKGLGFNTNKSDNVVR